MQNGGIAPAKGISKEKWEELGVCWFRSVSRAPIYILSVNSGRTLESTATVLIDLRLVQDRIRGGPVAPVRCQGSQKVCLLCFFSLLEFVLGIMFPGICSCFLDLFLESIPGFVSWNLFLAFVPRNLSLDLFPGFCSWNLSGKDSETHILCFILDTWKLPASRTFLKPKWSNKN